MSPTVRPLDRPASEAWMWALFVSLAAIWGSSFLFNKMLLQDGVPPLTIVFGRTLLGATFLGLMLILGGRRLRLGPSGWWRMSVLGLTNIVIPYTLIAWGQQYIPSGMASILNALQPIVAFVLVAVVVHEEAVTMTRVGGLLVGFAGVVLLALPSVGAALEDADAILAVEGMVAVALATVSYAVAAVYARRRLTGHALVKEADGSTRPPTAHELAFGSTFVGLVVVSVLALAIERPSEGLVHLPTDWVGWFATVWLGVLGTGVAYLLFFRLLERWGATRTTLVTYVLPVIAVTLGFVLLGERLRAIELVGAGLVIGGVVLVNGTLGGRRLRHARGAHQGPDLDTDAGA